MLDRRKKSRDELDTTGAPAPERFNRETGLPNPDPDWDPNSPTYKGTPRENLQVSAVDGSKYNVPDDVNPVGDVAPLDKGAMRMGANRPSLFNLPAVSDIQVPGVQDVVRSRTPAAPAPRQARPQAPPRSTRSIEAVYQPDAPAGPAYQYDAPAGPTQRPDEVRTPVKGAGPVAPEADDEDYAARKKAWQLRLISSIGRRGEQLTSAFDTSGRNKPDTAHWDKQDEEADNPIKELLARRAALKQGRLEAHALDREKLGDTRYDADKLEHRREFDVTQTGKAKEAEARRQHEAAMEAMARAHLADAAAGRADKKTAADDKRIEGAMPKVVKTAGDVGPMMEDYEAMKGVVGRNPKGIPGQGPVEGGILDAVGSVPLLGGAGAADRLIGVGQSLGYFTAQEAKDARTSRNITNTLVTKYEQSHGGQRAVSGNKAIQDRMKEGLALVNSGTAEGMKNGLEMLYNDTAAHVQNQRAGFNPEAVRRVQENDPGFNLQNMRPGDNPMPAPGSYVAPNADTVMVLPRGKTTPVPIHRANLEEALARGMRQVSE